MVFLLLLLVGCQRPAPFTFQIIDAQSGKGLAGVGFRVPVTGNHLGMRAFSADDDPEIEAKTDGNGYATLELIVDKGISYYLFITKSGYEAMTGPLDPMTGRCKLVRYPSDRLPAFASPREMPEIHVVPKSTTVISMHRLGGS
jgi:hypothetical protein